MARGEPVAGDVGRAIAPACPRHGHPRGVDITSLLGLARETRPICPIRGNAYAYELEAGELLFLQIGPMCGWKVLPEEEGRKKVLGSSRAWQEQAPVAELRR